MTFKSISLSLSALALAACASSQGLAPQLGGRNPLSLASHAAQKDIAVSEAAWPAADWWKALGDAQLDALIAEALRDNPGLDVADARVRSVAAAVGIADAARKPTVGAKLSTNGMRIPDTVLPQPYGDNYSTVGIASLSLNYSFDLWGGKRAAWEAALGSLRAAEVDARAARLELSVELARAYNQFAHGNEMVKVAEADRERARRLLKLNRQRFDAGLDSLAQVRQTEAVLASAEQRLAQAKHSVELARIALATLSGKGPDRGFELSTPAPLVPATLAVPADLPANLLGRRPDLVAARWRVEAASRAIDVAKAEFYPNVNLGAAIGLASMHTADFFSLHSRYAQLAPAISLPVFDGGRLRANLSARDAGYDEATAQYNQILVRAVGEVAEQLTTLRSDAEQLRAQQQALTASREAWSLSEQRFRKGVGSYLEVLTAQQSLLANEQQLAALQAQQLDASIQLVHALGGGFHDESRLPGALPRDRAATTTR
ncbi:efflux transporter outer membrane subunit [Niveibacterium terrae]|uniref:efflux transporter outer membrane subunit n=1 Tax=Niveibacterium terrae TaxID=3373598 RepID=UPI003A9478D9